ncbi:MAG: hypothetical protein HYX67_01200 [Candidatus Melainabacteria bacterium]|nr:hypothetical protein [Candidatus Melainabacteria bacterium]
MSDRHLGRIENTGDAGKQQQQFAQPWTPQMMTPKLDLSGAAPQVPSEFGNLQIVDNSQSRQLQGSAQMSHQAEPSVYHSAYDQRIVKEQHHNRLHAGAVDGSSQVHKQHQVQQREETLTGRTTVPASNTPDGYRPSETISTALKASDYHEGQQFSLLNIPHEKGKSNYYNGLANAHFENGHLYGVPVHMVNGRVTSHLAQEIDIELQKKR